MSNIKRDSLNCSHLMKDENDTKSTFVWYNPGHAESIIGDRHHARKMLNYVSNMVSDKVVLSIITVDETKVYYCESKSDDTIICPLDEFKTMVTENELIVLYSMVMDTRMDLLFTEYRQFIPIGIGIQELIVKYTGKIKVRVYDVTTVPMLRRMDSSVVLKLISRKFNEDIINMRLVKGISVFCKSFNADNIRGETTTSSVEEVFNKVLVLTNHIDKKDLLKFDNVFNGEHETVEYELIDVSMIFNVEESPIKVKVFDLCYTDIGRFVLNSELVDNMTKRKYLLNIARSILEPTLGEDTDIMVCTEENGELIFDCKYFEMRIRTLSELKHVVSDGCIIVTVEKEPIELIGLLGLEDGYQTIEKFVPGYEPTVLVDRR